SLVRAARQPHVRAARIRGVTGAALFYRHVWRGASGDVILGLGKILPVMLGVQLLAEWAFRFPGLGTLAVESARSGRLTGLLGAGWVLTTLVVVIRWLCDLVEAAVVPHPEREVVRR
ncbi:MAG: ABC transporter permease subunit, partial [Verrucomicrobiae bacterium]|nr:ABC transporter permease subunit [Verrucomicrobiae bacterium]